jgi:hypothetical protein
MQVTVDPLVAGLARDAVQLAQLGDVQGLTQVIGNKLGTLVHGRCLTPGHGAPPCGARECDTDCYPCPRTKVLPMCVDRTE